MTKFGDIIKVGENLKLYPLKMGATSDDAETLC